MALRKIDLMHNQFGFSPGHKCKECANFSREKYHKPIDGQQTIF